MTRSRRRYPIAGITKARSDREWKRIGHRATRKRCRQMLATDAFAPLPLVREIMDVWSMPKDGKRWHGWRDDILRK